MSLGSNLKFGIVSLTVSIVLSALCHGQQSVPSIADIEKVWKARQEKVTSAWFEMETERTIFKGYASSRSNVDRAKRKLAPLPENPPRDYLVKGTRRFSFRGIKSHDSYVDQAWDPVAKRLYPRQYTEVFDGRRFKSLDIPSASDEGYPGGIVAKGPQSGSALKFPLLPILITFRGSHPQYFNALNKFRVAGATVRVAGRPCLELVRALEDGQRSELLYVDLERSYVVVKMVIMDEGRPSWEWTTTYRSDSTVGWVPDSWEYLLQSGKGHRQDAGRRKVVRYEFNSNLDESEFDIRFPPRTKVNDTSGDQYVLYTILGNGEKGRAFPAGLGLSYEQLQEPVPHNRRWLLFWGALLLLAFLGSVRMWMRRRSRALSS